MRIEVHEKLKIKLHKNNYYYFITNKTKCPQSYTRQFAGGCCKSVCLVVVRCSSSWFVVARCGSLGFVMVRCGSLRFVVVGCIIQYNPIFGVDNSSSTPTDNRKTKFTFQVKDQLMIIMITLIGEKNNTINFT